MIKHGPHGPLMADTTAFMKSRVILTAAQLDIFTLLDDTPASSAQLAKRAGFNTRALTRVLDALTAFGFLNKEGGVYSLTERGMLLSSRHPGSVLPMVLHMGRLWDTWGDLTGMVRKGMKGRRKHASRMHPETLGAFIGAMDVVGRDLSADIAGSYDLGPFRNLLDIGGATGTYTISFLHRNPLMRAAIFDLDAVISMARERITAEGLSQRVDLIAGDFYKDEFPKGYDLVLLSAIIHQNDDRENVELYRKVFGALVTGGAILIRDHIMDDSRTAPASGTLFAINMLVNTRGGSTYAFAEVKRGLEKAGFRDAKLLRTGDKMDCLIEARKP